MLRFAQHDKVLAVNNNIADLSFRNEVRNLKFFHLFSVNISLQYR